MEDHSKADENFSITAANVLGAASRALEIFRSCEVNEERALLNFLLQNCVLSGRKFVFELKTPFDVIAQRGKTEDWLSGQDVAGTFSQEDMEIPIYDRGRQRTSQ